MATSTKAKKELPEEVVEVPEGVKATLSGNVLAVKGPLGEVKRDFNKIVANVSLEGGVVKVTPFSLRKKHRATMGTTRSLIENMVKGVTEGFTYKLKVVFAHFPITVKVKGNEVHIENFFGERAPRVAKIVGDCKVEVKDDDIIVKGVSLYDTGQTAANIEQATTIRNKDHRVFLDGVYVYEKRGKQ